MIKREAIFPANRHALYEAHHYSAAIRSGDLLFVSGQVGSREDGSPEPVFERQVQLAFDNLAAVLEAAGCTFDDIVDVTTFHTDPAAQFETVAAIRLKAIGGPPLPELDSGGGNLAGGLRFRDQGHRAHPPSPPDQEAPGACPGDTPSLGEARMPVTPGSLA